MDFSVPGSSLENFSSLLSYERKDDCYSAITIRFSLQQQLVNTILNEF